MDEVITVNDLIKYLNDLLAVDKKAITSLMGTTVTTNQGMADHPTVQVGQNSQKLYTLSPVGLLNGIFSTILYNGNPNFGQITVIRDQNTGEITRFLHTSQVEAYLKALEDGAPV